MADYPDAIFTPRTTENLPGIVYNAADTKTGYAEDYSKPAAEIAAIETVLGTNPNGAYETVKAWLTALSMGSSVAWGAITGTLSAQTDLQTALNGKQASLGYTAENAANKSTSVTTDQASNTKYPSVKAVYDWAVGAFQAALGYTAEDAANKSTSVTTDQASNTKYPSVKAVYDWATGLFLTLTGAQTMTNKRVQPRSSTAASGDITPDLATANIWQRTALSAAVTINAPTGTPVLGEVLVFLLKDNATPRAISWNGAFVPFGAALPATTTASTGIIATAQFDGTNWPTVWAEEQ